MNSSRTVTDAMRGGPGFTSGFDYVRLTLAFYVGCVLLADFVAPYGLEQQFRALKGVPPQVPQFVEADGRFHLQPFVYGYTSVVDEEQGGGGTLAAITRDLVCDAGIVAESTGLVVCPANRSNRRMRLKVTGLSAHSGEAFRGVNAIMKAFKYIDALFALAADLDRRRPAAMWARLRRSP